MLLSRTTILKSHCCLRCFHTLLRKNYKYRDWVSSFGICPHDFSLFCFCIMHALVVITTWGNEATSGVECIQNVKWKIYVRLSALHAKAVSIRFFFFYWKGAVKNVWKSIRTFKRYLASDLTNHLSYHCLSQVKFDQSDQQWEGATTSKAHW